jgi:diadenosine tetraphosphatase ApaH/serine/threonine PP2A family protein phosphatase
VSLVAQSCSIVLAGNHDVSVDGRLGTFFGSADIVLSQQWAQADLDPQQLQWLRGLKPYAARSDVDVDMWHGSIRDPLWEFVSDRVTALECMRLQTTPIGLVGHTHVPMSVLRRKMSVKDIVPGHNQIVDLAERQALLNPGAVGVPQGGRDQRASWMLLDLQGDKRTATFRRVAYPIAQAREEMINIGMSVSFADSLYGDGREH